MVYIVANVSNGGGQNQQSSSRGGLDTHCLGLADAPPRVQWIVYTRKLRTHHPMYEIVYTPTSTLSSCLHAWLRYRPISRDGTTEKCPRQEDC